MATKPTYQDLEREIGRLKTLLARYQQKNFRRVPVEERAEVTVAVRFIRNVDKPAQYGGLIGEVKELPVRTAQRLVSEGFVQCLT